MQASTYLDVAHALQPQTAHVHTELACFTLQGLGWPVSSRHHSSRMSHPYLTQQHFPRTTMVVVLANTTMLLSPSNASSTLILTVLALVRVSRMLLRLVRHTTPHTSRHCCHERWWSLRLVTSAALRGIIGNNWGQLRLLANEDTSVGLWMLAANVTHFEDMRLCSPSCT